MVRGQRQQGARRPRPPGARAERQLPQGGQRPGHDHAGDTLAKECHAGGTSQIYINLAGRDPAAGNTPQVPAANYEAVRNQIIAAFQNLDDPNLPGQQQVVLKVMKKEELRNVDGTDALHPNRSGDVVVVFRPPYQTDAQTPGQLVAPSQFFGQHGYLPEPCQHRAKHQHARDVHRGRAGHQASEPGRGRPGHRPRADARLPDGHPGAAERPRQDPPEHRQARAPIREVTILNISD